MPLYPTSVSRKRAGTAQNKARPSARRRAPRASKAFLAPQAVPLAAALARAGIPPSAAAVGLPIFPLLAGFAIGAFIGNKLYDQFFGGGSGTFVGQPSNYVDDTQADPLLGFPNWTHGAPNYDWSGEGGPAVTDTGPPSNGVALPVVDPADFGLYTTRYFFAAPNGVWFSSHFTRVSSDPTVTVLTATSYQTDQPLVLLPGAPPRTPPLALARLLPDSDWEQDYKTGDQRGPDKKIIVPPGNAVWSPPLNTPTPAGKPLPAPIGSITILNGSGPIPYDMATNVVVIAGGPGGPTTGVTGYSNEPPKRNEKEKKLKLTMHPRAVLLRIFNHLSEVDDSVDAIWKALPKEVRKKQSRSLQNKIKVIWQNRDKLNYEQAIKNLYIETVKDFYYGQLGQAGKRAEQNLHKLGYSTGGYTLQTKTSATGAGRLPEIKFPAF